MRSRRRRQVVILALSGWICSCVAPSKAEDPQQREAPSLQPKVRFETNAGEFTIELDAERAPATVLAFVDYVTAGFYDQTVFHRVVKGRMIHGGGYTQNLKAKTKGLRESIRYEGGNGLLNRRGTVAIYRRFEDLNSAQSQFFINTADNDQLDRLRDGSSYVVFGRVVEGMDVVDKISGVPVGTWPGFAAGLSPYVPVEPIIIDKTRVIAPLDRARAESKAREAVRLAEMTIEMKIQELESQAKSTHVETKSGLKYVVFKEGNGAFPNPEDSVEIKFSGTLMDGNEFDSSKARGDGPFVVTVDGLIRGLREGLQHMREGGRAVFVVPPELGFGMEGVPGKIPPGATLFYDVELVSVALQQNP